MRVVNCVLVFVLCLATDVALAQTVDLYRKVNDPRAIARLNGEDDAPTKARCFHDWPYWDIDTTDGYGIIARDSGAGVITHLWTTAAEPDSLVIMKLYINDTLVLTGSYSHFLTDVKGILRPPLDTACNGATTWDVQIPFHHGFKLSIKSPGNNLYFAVEWKSLHDGSQLPWFKLFPTYLEQRSQILTEKRSRDTVTPWSDPTSITNRRTDSIPGNSRVLLADIAGPAMIQMLRFQPSSYEFQNLDSTWLNIYWDNSPVPSVHAPLLDFFLSPTGVNTAHSFQLKADRDSGFISYFPMPFHSRAKVEIVREASAPMALNFAVQYNLEQIDREQYGYFHADFSESNPTRYHVYHPVVHTLGRGRYIGQSFGVYGQPFPVFLEGDPIFNVDSNQDNLIHYTGGEDYYDAGWWFAQGPFTLPFAGYTHFIDAFYRFHYFDCYDYTKSFDFDMEPGGNSDIYNHFRTVGYYFQHWTPFWTSRDTLRYGEEWAIEGDGYKANEAINIDFDDQSFKSQAGADGRFAFHTTVGSLWMIGPHFLSINGEQSPKKYYVLASPAIRALVDTLPITLCFRDSLRVSGTGFLPGEHVSFYLDSISLGQSTIADSNYGFTTLLRMPYLADHSYLLVARGERSGNATAQDRVTITRTLDYEFEDLMPPVDRTKGECYAENVSYFWMGHWSKQMFVYFKPDSIYTGAHLKFVFDVPHTDTFAVAYHGSVGKKLGHYLISIDGLSVANVDAFKVNDPDWWDPLPSGPIPCGPLYLEEGRHEISFTCLGKADSAQNFWVQPDNLTLTPTTYYPLSPGTLLASVGSTKKSSNQVELYYNSEPQGATLIRISLSAIDSHYYQSRCSVTLYDILGRSVAAFSGGYLVDGELRLPIGAMGLPTGTYFLQVQLTAADGATLSLPTTHVLIE